VETWRKTQITVVMILVIPEIPRTEIAAAMRALLARKIAEYGKKCGICGEPFTDCTDIVPDHIVTKGMGSAK
jgi:hypothetical protein